MRTSSRNKKCTMCLLRPEGKVHHLSHSTCGNRPTSTSPKSTFIPSNLPQARSVASSVPKSFGETRSPNTCPLFIRPSCLDSARTGCKQDAHLPGSAVLGRPLDKLLCQTS